MEDLCKAMRRAGGHVGGERFWMFAQEMKWYAVILLDYPLFTGFCAFSYQ